MTDELMHYGQPRRSGRYPFGSGDNPKAWYRFFGIKKKSETPKENDGSQAKTKSSSESKPLETTEELKKRLIEQENVEEIYAKRELFTTQEMRDLINRINTENDLKKLADARNTSAYKKGLKLLSEADSALKTVNSAIDTYNKFKKLVNNDNSSNGENNKNNKNNKNDSDNKNNGSKNNKKKGKQDKTTAEEAKQIIAVIRPLLEDKTKPKKR